MPSAPKTKAGKPQPTAAPDTAPVAPAPADIPLKDAVKAALANKKPAASWPKDPSTKHRKGKT